MKTRINKAQKQFEKEINSIEDIKLLEELRIEYLGREGIMTKIFDGIPHLSAEQKKIIGKEANKLKNEINQLFQDKQEQLLSEKKSNVQEKFYKSLPGIKPEIGHLHIITQAIREITEIFKPLGFNKVRYPEVDWEYFAFDSLNMPKDHPARDEWETFFVKAPAGKRGKMIITPHTSSGQVREMLKGALPIRMLNISRCGRREMDIGHIPTFYQFEGLLIDKNITIANLKGTLEYFAKNFFGESRKIRLRPYDFRFTEPSFEIDINCGLCLGAGCKFCRGGWVELGGAGMVHPNVLKAGKVDPKKYSGFAFGWGVERTYMMKSGTKLSDIRDLFKNDFRFLTQF